MGERIRHALLCGLLDRRRGHRLGAGGNGFDDVVIAGAAAKIAVKLRPDGLLIEIGNHFPFELFHVESPLLFRSPPE